MTLDEMKASARETATARGHNLGQWETVDHHTQRAECLRCRRGVDVDTRPPANGTEIDGGAVAVGCTVTVLPPDHTSPETAYTVADYPYGFRLRCQKRYWLESKPNHGHRLVSQTSNPKRPGLVWNAPKAGTYAKIAAVLLLDVNGHVKWDCLSEYSDAPESQKFLDDYRDGLTPATIRQLTVWIVGKVAVAASIAQGGNLREAAEAGRLAMRAHLIAEKAARKPETNS